MIRTLLSLLPADSRRTLTAHLALLESQEERIGRA